MKTLFALLLALPFNITYADSNSDLVQAQARIINLQDQQAALMGRITSPVKARSLCFSGVSTAYRSCEDLADSLLALSNSQVVIQARCIKVDGSSYPVSSPCHQFNDSVYVVETTVTLMPLKQ